MMLVLFYKLDFFKKFYKKSQLMSDQEILGISSGTLKESHRREASSTRAIP